MIANYKRPEITDTGHCLNEFTDTGHCLNDLTVSGKFITMAQQGNLMTVSWMIQERTTIAAHLQQVEKKLLACNNPLALASLAEWCERGKKDFRTELIGRAAKLETKKCELKVELQQIDEGLVNNMGFEWTFALDFASLIEISKPPDPTVAVRFMIVNKNRGKSAFEICKILDSHLRDGELPAGFFPTRWTEDYGVTTFVDAYRHPKCRNRVESLISKHRKKGP
jgi:hypothetical protein